MIFRNNPLETSGAVTLDLFNEFRNKGHEVRLLVNKYDPRYPDGITSMETFFLFWKNKLVNKLQRMLKLEEKRVLNGKYHFHDVEEDKEYYSTSRLLKKAKMKPDAIVILFAKNFVNAKNIYELNFRTKAPVYWMMYDTSPLTGGCHYSWDCKGYQKNCGKCPGLFSDDPFDSTYKNLLFKKTYLDKTDVSIVLASEWQQQQAEKSALFKNRNIYKILIAINPEVFKPVPFPESRKKFGIDVSKKVIFFGAYFFSQERKGLKYLFEAFGILKKMLQDKPEILNKILLLVAGQDVENIKEFFPFEYLSLGMLDNNYGVASAYQAADIFVCPSIEDAGPSMVNQSLMCGTPVVSFAQGVSLDIVITGKTGYRATLQDSHDLARGLYELLTLDEPGRMELKRQCRKLAMETFHPDVSTEHWLQALSNTRNKI